MKDIFNIAKKNKWVMEYDPDLDTLYWTKPIISPKATLKKFLEDFSLYLNGNEIEGLFIEYAKYNFVSHNTEYKPLIDQMDRIDKNRYILSKKEANKLEPLLRDMANKVAQETLDAVLKGREISGLVAA